MSIITNSKNHPLASYFFLVFLIAWLGSFLTVGPKYLRGDEIGFIDIGFMAIPMLFGPFIASIIMSCIVDGKQGFLTLFSRMNVRCVGARWYTTLLIFPVLLLTVSLVLAALISTGLAPTFFGIGILSGLLAGFLEETGWMGFAYPRMARLKRSILSTSLYLGLIHGVWHVVADFLGNFGNLGGYWVPYFIVFVVFMIVLRVLIVWVYTNTKSLLLAQLMHASSTGFLAMLIPMDLAPMNVFFFYSIYTIVLSVVAAIVVLKSGKNLVK
ncbi:type II CAAX prenyl endopeptidase Rce1 family protein [Chloroflexota bacterium]